MNLHVVIGRFEPPHMSHIRLIRMAALGADELLVILGSAYQAPTCKNPFTWEERQGMITSCLEDGPPLPCKVFYRPVRDSLYSDSVWKATIADTVSRFIASRNIPAACVDVTLVGVNKPDDTSTWYLREFPDWKYSGISSSEFGRMDATAIRSNLFNGFDTWQRFVHAPVRDFLNSWIHTDLGRRLRGEFLYCHKQQLLANRCPFPPTYTTADAVVIHRDRILLVRRKGELGRGLWALPGGFIDAKSETCYQSAKREAQEETGIVLQDDWCHTLRHAGRGGEVFDAPTRSLRGRTITHAYLFIIPDVVQVSPPRGADDAEYACWYPLYEVPGLEERMFEDHIEIIRRLTCAVDTAHTVWRPVLS